MKRYIGEKARFIREQTAADEHILIIPGSEDSVTQQERSRTYTIKSPLVSRTSRYRMLLRLEAVEEILERELPDLIESGDPYQVAWKAVHSGRALGIPVVGFYHSHFPEAYLRTTQKFLGRTVSEFILDFARRYICSLYNSFARTIVPSPALGQVLEEWGVRNVVHSDLGVDTTTFHPHHAQVEDVRGEHRIPAEKTLLLYVGRLAFEKNAQTLFDAFRGLAAENFHLMVVGDGLLRHEVERLQEETGAVTWLPYCAAPGDLAAIYRAADLLVHPGVQETFGLVTLEAQACGTPVIGIRGSYMDRIVLTDQQGWAAENTVAALAAAIVDAREKMKVMGGERLSRRVAARYSWTEVFGRLFDLYRQVIAERK